MIIMDKEVEGYIERYRLGVFREVGDHRWEVENAAAVVVVVVAQLALLWTVTVQLLLFLLLVVAVVVGKRRGLEKRTGFHRRDRRVYST